MADNERQQGNAPIPTESNEPKMVKDWSEDFFPTSARPVFIGYGVIVVGIIVLCATVYFLSPEKENPEKIKKQKDIAERMNPNADEDEDEVSTP